MPFSHFKLSYLLVADPENGWVADVYAENPDAALYLFKRACAKHKKPKLKDLILVAVEYMGEVEDEV